MLTSESSTVQTNPEVAQRLLVLEAMHDESFSPILLTPGKWTIGAAEESRIVLSVEGVQAQHCVLLSNDHQTVLKSWDERTWLNDNAVEEAELADGDRLAIGPVEFRLRDAKEDDRISQLSAIGENRDEATDGDNNQTDSERTPLQQAELDELRRLQSIAERPQQQINVAAIGSELTRQIQSLQREFERQYEALRNG